MEIKLFLNKDVNQNANYYFEKSKKLKAKWPGVQKAIEETKNKIKNLEKKKLEIEEKREKQNKLKEHIEVHWYEKFRWTKTSNNFLLVIGKDAGTNEVLIKKHLEENDLIFHTETPGSPFGLLKNSKEKASKQDLEEAAQFVASFSQQWKRGFGTADAFYVETNQVSKKAQSGEYIAKGSFMIRGKKNILKNVPLRICLGVEKKKIQINDNDIEYEDLFSGSEKACKKFCGNRFIKIEPGTTKYKALAKDVKKKLKTSIADLPKYIPNESKILKK